MRCRLRCWLLQFPGRPCANTFSKLLGAIRMELLRARLPATPRSRPGCLVSVTAAVVLVGDDNRVVDKAATTQHPTGKSTAITPHFDATTPVMSARRTTQLLPPKPAPPAAAAAGAATAAAVEATAVAAVPIGADYAGGVDADNCEVGDKVDGVSVSDGDVGDSNDSDTGASTSPETDRLCAISELEALRVSVVL